MALYIGKCSACRSVKRQTAEDTGQRKDVTGNGFMRPVLRLADNTEVTPLSVAEFAMPCPCGTTVVYRLIAGKHNPAKPCDQRCWKATSSKCECSCGGANHGVDHVVPLPGLLQLLR